MKPIRSRSPKLQNNYVNNYNQSPNSPNRKQFNIINLNNNQKELNKRNYNNHFIFNYSNSNYNYYEEISKAFNFITFILKQKDSQIMELKLKIKNLERQLNDINETNMMTFNNQEIVTNSSNASHIKILNNKNFNNKIQNNINLMSSDTDNNKINNVVLNSLFTPQTDIKNNNNTINNNSGIINIYKNNNFVNDINKNNIDIDNKINIIHKIKNSKNLNKINNYDITNIGKINNNYNIDDNNRLFNDDIQNKAFNINTNEHSSDKKNINKIRKESYHSSQNININIRNKHGSTKEINNLKSQNFSNENENTIEHNKLKIVTFDNFAKPGSKSNSFNLSEEGGTITSKSDVKNYLKEVKHKLEPDKFKKFITQIKALTKNKNNEQKNTIILQIKNILMDKNLISKFEMIMKVNKN